MKKFLFLLFAAYQVTLAMAQFDGEIGNVNDLKSDMLIANGLPQGAYVQGNPYLKEEFVPGIFYLNNKTYVEKQTRINYYYNNFEYDNEGKTFIVDATTVDSVICGKATYVFRNYTVEGKNSLRALKIIAREGQYSIYEYIGAEFKPEIKAAGYVDPKPARFEWNDPVYLFEKEKKLVPLNNVKAIIPEFPGKEDVIQKFIKENKIRKLKPEELRKLLVFVSSL